MKLQVLWVQKKKNISAYHLSFLFYLFILREREDGGKSNVSKKVKSKKMGVPWL